MLQIPIPCIVSEEFEFDDHVINGVFIPAVGAYSEYDVWYGVLVDLIPKMGEGYLDLFMLCGFRPFEFLKLAIAINDPESEMTMDVLKSHF